MFETLAGVGGVILPVFGVVALGYGAVRWRALDAAATDGLSGYVFSFAIPLMLFRLLATAELPSPLPWDYLLAYYGAALATQAVGVAAGFWLVGARSAGPAVLGMGASFSNTTLLGIPIVLVALGDEAGLPVVLLVAFHSLVLLAVATVHLEISQGAAVGTGVARSVRGLARNPILVGIGAGLVWGTGGLTLPSVVDGVVELVARSAVPCSLFAMGASLTRTRFVGARRAAVLSTILKLGLHPALVWVLAVPLLALDPLYARVAVLMAALPTGVSVFLFAQHHKAEVAATSGTVLLTTALSPLTLGAVLVLLGVV